MSRQHFLVQKVDGDYKLREIDTMIANGIHEFGTTTTNCQIIEKEFWTFYFMNCNYTHASACEVAVQLADRLRQESNDLISHDES